MTRKVYLQLILLLSIFSINLAVSPRFIYYSYHLNGEIECDTITDKSNYIIRLYGKGNANADEDYFLMDGMQNEFEHPVGVSDSTGYFYILVNHPYFVDSVKLGVYYSPDSTWFSDAFATDPRRLQEVTESFEREGSGCSCNTVQPMETVTVKYDYIFPETFINHCD